MVSIFRYIYLYIYIYTLPVVGMIFQVKQTSLNDLVKHFSLKCFLKTVSFCKNCNWHAKI